jgi:hypothetical protein
MVGRLTDQARRRPLKINRGCVINITKQQRNRKEKRTMLNEQNIYEKGVLIALHMGGYEGRKKLSKEQLKDLPTEIVRGVHDLFDKEFKELLAAIWTLDSKIRDTVKAKCVPFPVDGIYFLPSSKIEEVMDYLKNMEIERNVAIQKAADVYEDAIIKFSEKYPEFYTKARGSYISLQQFRDRFYFQYQFLKIAPPDKDSLLSPEVYKKELAKFRESVQEMKNDVLGTIATTLLEATKKLKDQCVNGKPNQRTLNSLNKFLIQIDEVYSDFVDRKDMKKAISAVKASILGVDAESLRSSKEDFRKEFEKAITEAAETIKALPDIPLKRAIEF